MRTAREVTAKLRIVLVSETLDGPGLGAQTWPDIYFIRSQEPPPGAALDPGGLVTITFELEDGSGPPAHPSPYPRDSKVRDTRAGVKPRPPHRLHAGVYTGSSGGAYGRHSHEWRRRRGDGCGVDFPCVLRLRQRPSR
ncbi:hypothetical protein [Gryllotalpicola protaetiae]|uniref:hypothetical protein n=1 Tax=Gryllotalpicola protaetiae TaxID=2419771 RepID=UPI003CCC531C